VDVSARPGEPRTGTEQLLGTLSEVLLGGDPDVVVVGEELAPAAFDELVGLARQERVTGVLAASVREGLLVVSDEQFEAVALAHRGAMAVALVLERLLVESSRTLSANGVDHLVLKGPALAHLAYPDPGMRDYGDVDLLVAADLMPLAVRVLLASGAHRPLAELAPGWDRSFAKSVTLVGASGYELDVHRTIAPGVFGLRVEPAILFTRTQTFTVGDVRLRALAPEGQLLQACMHAAAGNRRVWLSSVCDIVLLSRSGQVDRRRFHDLVQHWGVAAVVERAVAIVEDRLGGADVSDLLDGLIVSAVDRRRLGRYGHGFSGPARTGFGALPLRRWPSYGRALFWPSGANLDDRGMSRVQHVRRLGRHLR